MRKITGQEWIVPREQLPSVEFELCDSSVRHDSIHIYSIKLAILAALSFKLSNFACYHNTVRWVSGWAD